MSKYRVLLTKKAQKNLDKIRGNLYDFLYSDLLKLESNPFPVGCKKLVNNNFGKYRIRVGDYRIVYDVNNKKKMISILKIGHRKEIYR